MKIPEKNIVEATVHEISARKRAAEPLLQAADAQDLARLAPAPAHFVELKNALEAANGAKSTATAINAPTSPCGRPNLIAHHIVFAIVERIDLTIRAFWQAIHFYVSTTPIANNHHDRLIANSATIRSSKALLTASRARSISAPLSSCAPFVPSLAKLLSLCATYRSRSAWT